MARSRYQDSVDLEYNPYDYDGNYKTDASLEYLEEKELELEEEDEELYKYYKEVKFDKEDLKEPVEDKKSYKVESKQGYDYQDEDDDEASKFIKHKEIEEDSMVLDEEDEVILDMSTVASTITAKDDMIYSILKSKIDRQLKADQNLSILDFTSVEVDDYAYLVRKLEEDLPGMTCRNLSINAEEDDTTLRINFSSILGNENPLNEIPLILLNIEQLTKGEPFTLVYDLAESKPNALHLVTLAVITLHLKERVYIRLATVRLMLLYNKALNYFYLPDTSNPTTALQVISKYYKDNYKPGKLVAICENITVRNMINSSFVGIIDSVNDALIHIRKISSVDILKGYKADNKQLVVTQIHLSDINAGRSLVLPIETTEEYAEIIGALRHESFRKEIPMEALTSKSTLEPDLSREKIISVYYSIANKLSKTDEDLLNKLRLPQHQA